MTMTTKEDQREILRLLKEPFAPEQHQERDLPGGNRWFFIKWQDIRERLDEVCPDWEVDYSDPIYIDAYCTIKCTLTIAGIKRSAPGNGEIKNKRGTPIENAVADSFKNASEAFGVARYLDEQSKEAREFTVRYLHSKGDGRGKKRAIENGYLENSTARSLPSKPAPQPSASSDAPVPETSEPEPQKKLPNENGRRVKEACGLLGMKGRQTADAYNAAAIAQKLDKPSGELTAPECSRVIDEILALWGFKRGGFKAINHARNAFASLMENPEISDMAAIVVAWRADCEKRVEKSQEVTATW